MDIFLSTQDTLSYEKREVSSEFRLQTSEFTQFRLQISESLFSGGEANIQIFLGYYDLHVYVMLLLLQCSWDLHIIWLKYS